jgi:hypothetical protein
MEGKHALSYYIECKKAAKKYICFYILEELTSSEFP